MIVLSLLLALAAPAPAAARHSAHPTTHRRAVRRTVGRGRHVTVRLRLGCGYSATGLCATARSPYRLPLDPPLPPSGKAEALAQTGARCGEIGQTICQHHPHTILHVVK